MCMGGLPRSDNHLGVCFGIETTDIVRYGPLDKLDRLRQIPDMRAERVLAPLVQRGVIEPNLAARKRNRASDCTQQGRLAAGRRTDDRQHVPGLYAELNALHHRLAQPRIRHRDILAVDLAAGRRQAHWRNGGHDGAQQRVDPGPALPCSHIMPGMDHGAHQWLQRQPCKRSRRKGDGGTGLVANRQCGADRQCRAGCNKQQRTGNACLLQMGGASALDHPADRGVDELPDAARMASHSQSADDVCMRAAKDGYRLPARQQRHYVPQWLFQRSYRPP